MGAIDRLTDDEAQWLERMLEASTPPLRMSIPISISATLLERGIIRRMGPNFVITSLGLKALVHYRSDRRKPGG